MKNWYALHVYSGQEYKVAERIKKMITLGELPNVFDAKVPTKKIIVSVGNKKKERDQKIIPGYILLAMTMPSVDWKKFLFSVRRISGVSGFVGSQNGSKPMPISQEEYKSLLDTNQIINKSSIINSDSFSEGEKVRIVEGPFETFVGKIVYVNKDRSKLKVIVGILGSDTPVDLTFTQVEKV